MQSNQIRSDQMAGWHHWLNGHESQWTLEVGDGQGGLACCDSWGHKESDTTERLIWSDYIFILLLKELSLFLKIVVHLAFLCFLLCVFFFFFTLTFVFFLGDLKLLNLFLDFPGGSDSKASAYNEEDLGSIPG